MNQWLNIVLVLIVALACVTYALAKLLFAQLTLFANNH